MIHLVGRDPEVRWLQDRITRSEEGVSSILLVSGEAGIGKTHLVRATLPGDRLLASIGFPHGHFATPGLGLRTLAQVGGDAADQLRRELGSTDLEPDRWRFLAIQEAADHLLRALPGGIIVFDDLQWADELTLAWLSQAVPALRASSVTIVATVRTPAGLPPRIADALIPAMRDGLVDSIELRPLALGAVAELAAAWGYAPDGDLVDTLQELTSGIPLAVREVLRELRRRGLGLDALAREDLHPLPTLPLVAGIVREQIADLDRDALQVLAVCCLAPPPVSESTIKTVAGLDAPRFDAALGAAIRSGLLVRGDRATVAFRHGLQREAFHGEISFADRRAMHRRLASVLAEDPTYPAGPIADQLVKAGLAGEAVEWLERAARESGQAHDHGNALAYLEAAVAACSATDSETFVRLAERAVIAARCSNEMPRGLGLVASALERVTDIHPRGRLLLCRAKLASFHGDFAERARSLEEARRAFVTTDDAARLARVLAELAFPAGDALTLEERSRLGSEGLALAERLNDTEALVHCSINLASAKFFAGDPTAFELWAKAAALLEENLSAELGRSASTGLGRSDSPPSVLLLRNYSNWSLAALSYGNYGEARRVMDAGLALCRVPFWEATFGTTRTLYLWRTGDWDAALEAARAVQRGITRPQATVMAAAIESAIVFEREAQPDVTPLIRAVRSLIRWSDEEFGSIAQAILMHIRCARREPRPDRDLMSLVDMIARSGARIGWEDLLPATAEIEPALYRRVSGLVDAERLTAPRALAARALGEGIAAAAERSPDAEPSLTEATERFLALPEPHPAARALETLGHLMRGEGKRCSDAFLAAAEIYHGLGAERSLATLLRRAGNHRVLQPFKVPTSQSHSGAPGLTPRESDVADLARRGYTAREIGAELGIATVTAKKHLERIKNKLGAERKSDLIRMLADGY